MCGNNMRRYPGMGPSRVRAAAFPIALPRIPRSTSVRRHRVINFISDGGCSNRADIHTTVAFVLRVIIGAPPRTCGICARDCTVAPPCRCLDYYA